jgi:cellulose synthase/poly-beta-1,6-N-acetylglucosamine synthase-like glycosyltransferase
MNFNNFGFAAVNAAAFMLSASFLIYVTSIVVPFLRHRPAAPGDSTEFLWHFVVPCLDEERVIERTIARLRADFPDGHVWCIDDASVDDTPAIVRRLSAADPQVHMVTRRLPNARVGKGPALNAAWRAIGQWLPPQVATDRVVIGVIDADGYLDPRCLEVVSGARYFANSSVSAVQIQVRVSNGDRQSDGASGASGASSASRVLVRMQDMEFTTVIAAIQMLRHNVGSVGMGGNGQFTRLSALDRVAAEYGEPWRDALIEDFELGLHVLLTGGRNEYCHETWVSQQGPPTFRLLVRQRSRWGQGAMQCIRYLNPVLRSPQISTGAAVEITYFLMLPWLQIFGDLVYVVALMALIYASFTVPGGPVHWLGDAGAWQLIPMFLIFGIGPLVIWGPIYRRHIANDLSRRQAWALGLANWPYIFVHHFAVWWAFSRMLRSRHDWKKTERLDWRALVPGFDAGPAFADALIAAFVPAAAFAFPSGYAESPSLPRPAARERVSGTGGVAKGAVSGRLRPAALRTPTPSASHPRATAPGRLVVRGAASGSRPVRGVATRSRRPPAREPVHSRLG